MGSVPGKLGAYASNLPAMVGGWSPVPDDVLYDDDHFMGGSDSDKVASETTSWGTISRGIGEKNWTHVNVQNGEDTPCSAYLVAYEDTSVDTTDHAGILELRTPPQGDTLNRVSSKIVRNFGLLGEPTGFPAIAKNYDQTWWAKSLQGPAVDDSSDFGQLFLGSTRTGSIIESEVGVSAGIGFEYYNQTLDGSTFNQHWYATAAAVTAAGGGSTGIIDTGVTLDTNWHKFRISHIGGSLVWAFFIDDVLVGTVTMASGDAHLFYDALPIAALLNLNEVGAQDFYVDLDRHRLVGSLAA